VAAIASSNALSPLSIFSLKSRSFPLTTSSTRSNGCACVASNSARYVDVGRISHRARSPFSTRFRHRPSRFGKLISAACAGYPGNDFARTTTTSASTPPDPRASPASSTSIVNGWSGSFASHPGVGVGPPPEVGRGGVFFATAAWNANILSFEPPPPPPNAIILSFEPPPPPPPPPPPGFGRVAPDGGGDSALGVATGPGAGAFAASFRSASCFLRSMRSLVAASIAPGADEGGERATLARAGERASASDRRGGDVTAGAGAFFIALSF
jgi:hypothetical protein